MNEREFYKLFVKSNKGVVSNETLSKLPNLSINDLHLLINSSLNNGIIRIADVDLGSDHPLARDSYIITNYGRECYKALTKRKFREDWDFRRNWLALFISVCALIISLVALMRTLLPAQ